MFAQHDDPELSHDITPHLTQGKCPPPGTFLVERGYGVLVLAAVEKQPHDLYYPGVTIVRAAIDDSGPPISSAEWADAGRAAEKAARAMRDGRRVWSSCHMGLNRSGLVSAIALHMLTGMSGKAAVDLVRICRPGALKNPSFVAALERLPDLRLRRPPQRVPGQPRVPVRARLRAGGRA